MNDTASTKPIKISPSATTALTGLVRQWTGWGYKASLVLGPTGTGSPYAACFHDPVFEVRVDPEHLLLNPNRVLKTVTPFRLRQEALLTGAILHEAGHARHSHWQPGRYGNPDPAVHGADFNSEPVSDLVLEFAKTLEEARIEGLIAGEASQIGAHGLAWTMRCSAIHVLPFTEVSLDPAQQVLDVLCSWVLRAGRQVSTAHHYVETGRTYKMPSWVHEFNLLLGKVCRPHIAVAGATDATEMLDLMTMLYEGVTYGEDADAPGSTYMVDIARKILDLLFPPEQQENLGADSRCAADMGDEDDEDADESDDQDSDRDESPSEDGGAGDEADEDDTDGESDEDGEDGEDGQGDTEPEDEGSGSDPGAGDSGSDASDQPSDKQAQQQQAETQAALDAVESKVAEQAEQEQAEEVVNPSEGPAPEAEQAEQEDDAQPTLTRSAGDQRGRGRDADFRQPTGDERGVKQGAERFLRNLIDPSESGKQQITDSPAALVDGAALAAWKAGGQTADPRFFKRIKRTAQPAPPVKIAILVDRSASMDVLDKPSSLLSWALAAAALDLRNFAGRGVQVQSTLIHWGSDARVVQAPGEVMPGVFEGECMESTVAMDEALDLVARQLPGFFEPMGTNENRLLVQFTDWELARYNLDGVTQRIDKAITNGVNMLSVVPMNYSWRSTCLDPVLASIRQPKGRSALLRYNPDRPQEVWSAAAEVLSGADTNYGF